MLQPSGPSASKRRPLGPPARRAMPPSPSPVRQPPTFVSLADLGVEQELFQRAASSQGCATTGAFNLNEVGLMLASKVHLEDPGFEPRVGLFRNATGKKSDGEYIVSTTAGRRSGWWCCILTLGMPAFVVQCRE